GREVGWVGLGCGLEGAHVDLEPVAELLDSAEHPHRVAFGEAGVEELDVVPNASVDPPTRVDQLEREVWSAALRPHSLFARDRVDPFDDPLLGQLCDGAHRSSDRAVEGASGETGRFPL